MWNVTCCYKSQHVDFETELPTDVEHHMLLQVATHGL